MLTSKPVTAALGKDSELEKELLAHPLFARGTLQFIRRLPAKHSELLEYVFRSCEGTKSLFVKRQAPSAKAQHITVAEFENLTTARKMLGASLGESVPEPILAIPAKGILVTARVPGIPLTAILKKYGNRLVGRFCTSAIHEATRHAGMWLNRFQHMTQSEPVTFSAHSHLADLEVHLSQCRQKGIEFTGSSEILRLASYLAFPLDGRKISSAARHGDFVPQNVMVDNGRIAVVDFEGLCERAASYEDLGMFLGYLLILRTRPSYSAHALKAACTGFLEGYGNLIDGALLSIYALQGAVRVIANGPNRAATWRRESMARALERRLECLASRQAI